MTFNRYVSLIAMLTVVVACQPAEETVTDNPVVTTASNVEEAPLAANVTDQRLLNTDNEPEQWMTYGGGYEEQRYSQLDELTAESIDGLGLSWFADYDSNLQQQGTPLYVDGVLYVSIPWAKLYAFDASTGEQLWMYNPNTTGEVAPKICCGIVNRGIAAYEGKIYIGTLDGYLVAVDAATGEEVWRSLTVDQDKMYSITSAPRIANGMVYIGNSGSEFGVRGYIGAYDAETGEEQWRFYTVPGNPEDGFENSAMAMAAETWSGDYWVSGGGGTVWDAIVYDDVNDHIYFGTGNGTPWNQLHRDPEGGDNLFLASIVAIDASTGEYKWHYQTTPGDTWDYDAVGPMMIAELDWNGVERRVLMQPNKNGMMYVLDAASGGLLKADAFTTVNWNEGLDESGYPIFTDGAKYAEGPFNLAPGVQGGHGWHANAYSPDTGYVYIATQDAWFVMASAETYTYNPEGSNLGINMAAGFAYQQENPEAPSGFTGFLQAWDPVTGERVWKGEDNSGPTGGAVATAGGLVFSGGGTNNDLRAYDAETGEKLWSFDAQTPVLAPPISYEHEGKQYIAVSVGGNNSSNYFQPNYSRLQVFSLGGDAVLPEAVEFSQRPLAPPERFGDELSIATGETQYEANCAICHGANGVQGRSTFPNLTRTPMLHAQEAFDTVVMAGVRLDKGMPSFEERLTADDSIAIRSYLVSRANDLLENGPAPSPFGPPPADDAPADAHDDLIESDAAQN